MTIKQRSLEDAGKGCSVSLIDIATAVELDFFDI